jgi:hypothetical protein
MSRAIAYGLIDEVITPRSGLCASHAEVGAR